MDGLLFAAVLETRGYIVGDSNKPSGLHVRHRDGQWLHKGWKNIRCFAIEQHPGDASTLLMAAGNGVLRSGDFGNTWRVLTDWRVTEVLDIAIDTTQHETLFAATAHGVWRSRDGGATWSALNDGLASTFIQSIVVDSSSLLCGTEEGVHTLSGNSWECVGPNIAIRHLQPSIGGARWMAATEDHGLWLSTNEGRSWTQSGVIDRAATLYVTAITSDGKSAAVAGYRTGVWLLDWQNDEAGPQLSGHFLQDRSFHALHITPETVVAGSCDDGVYTIDRSSGNIEHVGLREANVRSLGLLRSP